MHRLQSICARPSRRGGRVVRAPGITVALIIAACFTLGACDNRTNEPANSIVVLNAPASGTVRRVMVGEGVTVEAGAPVIEIAVETASAPAPSSNESDTRTRAEAQRATAENLQREVERAAVEVARMESLVAANSAPQPQLDAARAEYQRAQERLQQARDNQTTSEDRLAAERGNASDLSNISSPPRETTAYVRATTRGTVRVVSVRAGQRVVAGQPLVTLLPDER